MPPRQTSADASHRRDRIVTAARDVFLRYGHARTTMGDVADAAGLSRPALYLVFPRKDDIFAAMIARLTRDELQKYRDAMPGLGSLDRRLHYCCEQWAGHGYDLTKAQPDARDVFNLAFPPVREMYTALEGFFAELLRDAVVASRLETTPEELARLLIFGLRGLKDIAKDGADMRRMIALQVDVVLASIRE